MTYRVIYQARSLDLNKGQLLKLGQNAYASKRLGEMNTMVFRVFFLYLTEFRNYFQKWSSKKATFLFDLLWEGQNVS